MATPQWGSPGTCADALLAALSAAGYAVLKVDDEPHVIQFREDGWTVQHPLSCRPALFDCPVNRAAEQELDGPPATGLGIYEISLRPDGLLQLQSDATGPLVPVSEEEQQ